MFRILHQDDELVVIDKPAGFQVHPSEDPRHRLADRHNCLKLLRRQLGKFVYPVHRLDRATSGVLLFALSSEAAGRVQACFASGQVRKTYVAVVRGWTDSGGCIDRPLAEDGSEVLSKPAQTDFVTLAHGEWPDPVGRYASSRLSLLRVEPRTGRHHQIRRHFHSISHPLLGDTVHGDGKVNRWGRTKWPQSGLWLKAYALELEHRGQRHRRISRWNGEWHRMFDDFGVCPWVST